MDLDPIEEQLIIGAEALPIDMIEDFLRLLTVRPLMRMRVVSQEWNNLISSRAFGRRHRDQMRRTFQWMYYFFTEAVYMPLAYEGRFIYIHADRIAEGGDNQVDVLCSGSGLICGITLNNEIFLFNLLTHRIFFKEQVPINCPHFVRTGRLSYSLGYNETEDDFLLVRIIIFGGEVARNKVVVYSRNNMVWINCIFKIGCVHFWTPTLARTYWGIRNNDCFNVDDDLHIHLLTVVVPGPDPIMYTYLDRLGDEALCLYSSLTHRGGIYGLCILTNYNSPQVWQTVNIYLGVAICVDEFYVNLQPLRYVDQTRTMILFRVNPVGSFMAFNTTTSHISLLRVDFGIEGQVTVVRFLQTLEDP